MLWRKTRLPHQIVPDDHFGAAMITGRGAGKTHAGSNWARWQAFSQPGSVGAVVAPTYRDLRNTVFPALFQAVPPGLFEFKLTNWEMTLANGSTILGFTGQEPDRIRGANLSWAWCDELAFWQYVDDTWSNLLLALRIGEPRVFVSTTPRNVELLKTFLDDPAWVVMRATTYDNPFLAASAVSQMDSIWGGTTLGRQELMGEFIDEIPGALWKRAQLDECYRPEAPEMTRIVVGVDPSGGRAEIGIVVCGIDKQKRGWLLADLSMVGSPAEWGKRAVDAYHGWKADRIVVERNFGGDMAEHTIRTVDKAVPIRMVTASRGKHARAEPVAALYEQGRVFHTVRSAKLEDQMCTWTDDDKTSPDRLDAMVWGFTELMITGRSVPDMGPGGVTGPSKW